MEKNANMKNISSSIKSKILLHTLAFASKNTGRTIQIVQWVRLYMMISMGMNTFKVNISIFSYITKTIRKRMNFKIIFSKFSKEIENILAKSRLKYQD